MSPIIYLVIPVALAAFAAAILGLFALANATAEAESKEQYIRELETEIGKLKRDRRILTGNKPWGIRRTSRKLD